MLSDMNNMEFPVSDDKDAPKVKKNGKNWVGFGFMDKKIELSQQVTFLRSLVRYTVGLGFLVDRYQTWCIHSFKHRA